MKSWSLERKRPKYNMANRVKRKSLNQVAALAPVIMRIGSLVIVMIRMMNQMNKLRKKKKVSNQAKICPLLTKKIVQILKKVTVLAVAVPILMSHHNIVISKRFIMRRNRLTN